MIVYCKYLKIFRTKEIISEDRARFAKAWNTYFGNYGTRGGPEPNQAFDAWFEMIKERYLYHVLKIDIDSHPKYIKERLNNINEDEFGYDTVSIEDQDEDNYFHASMGGAAIRQLLRDLVVVKSNGQKEIFDRDKMFRALSLALRKRTVDQDKIEKIVNAIVRKLENSGDTEINSSLIGEYIMEALAHLDQVAYVRFASVYKNFREVKDFEDFLDNLEEK